MLGQLSLGFLAAVIVLASGDVESDIKEGVDKATNIEVICHHSYFRLMVWLILEWVEMVSRVVCRN